MEALCLFKSLSSSSFEERFKYRGLLLTQITKWTYICIFQLLRKQNGQNCKQLVQRTRQLKQQKTQNNDLFFPKFRCHHHAFLFMLHTEFWKAGLFFCAWKEYKEFSFFFFFFLNSFLIRKTATDEVQTREQEKSLAGCESNILEVGF